MTTSEKWQKQIDGIWQETFCIAIIKLLEMRIKRIAELKAAGVKPIRKNGKIVVPK